MGILCEKKNDELMAKNKKELNDKFYTKDEIVKKVMSELILDDFDLIIEPSAGNGAFLEYINKHNHVALDLVPEHDAITQCNWFEYELTGEYKNILVIGNPPFGVQGSLALDFINKAHSIGANTIAFILPKSFKKHTLKNRIPLNFHLEKEIDIEENSFLLNGVDYDVPCVFQMWVKNNEKRKITKLKTTTQFFDFVKKTDDPEISFRRVGFYAGRIYDTTQDKSFQSHYFIKSNGIMSLDTIKNIISDIKWEHNNTTGPKSIGKGELIQEFEKKNKIIN